jgi:hypothetical protein
MSAERLPGSSGYDLLGNSYHNARYHRSLTAITPVLLTTILLTTAILAVVLVVILTTIPSAKIITAQSCMMTTIPTIPITA